MPHVQKKLIFFATIFIVLTFSTCNNILMKKIEITHNFLLIKNENFWKIFNFHFSTTSYVTITVIHPKNNYEIKLFVDKFIETLHLRGHRYNLISRAQTVLVDDEIDKDQYQNEISPPICYPTLKNATELTKTLVKLKKFSSGLHDEGHVIIATETAFISEILRQNSSSILGAPRHHHLLIVTCTCQHQISAILHQLWTKFDIINAIAATPSWIYTYKPFHQNGNSWGATYRHSHIQARSNFAAILHQIRNLNSYHLPVTIFNRFPTAINQIPHALTNRYNLSYSGGFAGADGIILAAIAQKLNLKVQLIPTQSEYFGDTLENGSVTGSLGFVAYRMAQLGANGRFLDDYGTNIEYTFPYSSDDICPVTKKAKRIPQWRLIFRGFSDTTWTVIVLTVLVFAMLPHLKNDYWQRFAAVAAMMGMPFNIRRPGHAHQVFIYLSCMVFYTIIVEGVLEGLLFKAYSQVQYYKDINTLSDLVDSGLPIVSTLSVLNSDVSKLMETLRKRRVYARNGLNRTGVGEAVATLQRRKDVEFFIENYFMTENGPLLHISKQCIVSQAIALIVPKGSPMLHVFNRILRQIVEAGLSEKWYKDTLEALIYEELVKPRKEERTRAFRVGDLKAAFLLLAIGWGVAGGVFLAEVGVKRWHRAYK